MSIFSEAIARLEAAPFAQRMLFPSSLSAAIGQYVDNRSAGREWGVIVACLIAKHTIGAHRLLPCLKQFRHDIRDVIARVYCSSEANSKVNWNLACYQNDHLIAIDYFLFNLDFVISFDTLSINHQYRSRFYLAKTLNFLIELGLMIDETTLRFVFERSNSKQLLQSFLILHSKKLLNVETVQKLRHSYHDNFASVLQQFTLSTTIELTQPVLDRLFALSRNALSYLLNDLQCLIILGHEDERVVDALLECVSKKGYQVNQNLFEYCSKNYALNSQVAYQMIRSQEPHDTLIDFLSKTKQANVLSHTVLFSIFYHEAISDVIKLLQWVNNIELTQRVVIRFSENNSKIRASVLNTIQQDFEMTSTNKKESWRLSESDMVQLLNNNVFSLGNSHDIRFFFHNKEHHPSFDTEVRFMRSNSYLA